MDIHGAVSSERRPELRRTAWWQRQGRWWRAACIGIEVFVIANEAMLTGDRPDLVGHEHGFPGCSGFWRYLGSESQGAMSGQLAYAMPYLTVRSQFKDTRSQQIQQASRFLPT